MTRRRLRRIAKWTCTIAAMLVVGAAGFSVFRTAEYWYLSKDMDFIEFVALHRGRLLWRELRFVGAWGVPGKSSWSMSESPPWSEGTIDEMSERGIWRAGVYWKGNHPTLHERAAGVILLYPFLLAAIPAGLLWWKDLRPFRPGRCPKCGYDRAGLAADAACPECGTPPAPATV
jgi:hypothetical protein